MDRRQKVIDMMLGAYEKAKAKHAERPQDSLDFWVGVYLTTAAIQVVELDWSRADGTASTNEHKKNPE